jgi:hypothetical protein
MPGRTCSEIVKEAKNKGLWIYDPDYKKWYTPEDFQRLFGNTYDREFDHLFKRLQIRHPSEGIGRFSAGVGNK